jgi:hypothetical protein
MAPKRKSALEELIRLGFVKDGELLRYKVSITTMAMLILACVKHGQTPEAARVPCLLRRCRSLLRR